MKGTVRNEPIDVNCSPEELINGFNVTTRENVELSFGTISGLLHQMQSDGFSGNIKEFMQNYDVLSEKYPLPNLILETTSFDMHRGYVLFADKFLRSVDSNIQQMRQVPTPFFNVPNISFDNTMPRYWELLNMITTEKISASSRTIQNWQRWIKDLSAATRKAQDNVEYVMRNAFTELDRAAYKVKLERTKQDQKNAVQSFKEIIGFFQKVHQMQDEVKEHL